MKKIIIVVIVVLLIVCTAIFVVLNNRNRYDIKQNENDDINVIDSPNVTDDSDDKTTIEIRGNKYKDINSVPTKKVSFDNNLVYAEPIREGADSYIKLSDDFFINESKAVRVEEFDSEKRIAQIEILPSKIYSSDEDAKFLYEYENEVFFIPVEKCASGEEKIVYRDYGLEVIQKNDSIKINDKIVEDVISGWDLRDIDFSRVFDKELRYSDVSLCEAYMESWKISDKKMNFYDEREGGYADFAESMLAPQVYTHIYQVDLDDDENSLELIYTSGIIDHVNIDTTLPRYSIVSYDTKQNQTIRVCEEEMLWFNNVLNYKNVFYGYDAFEFGPKIDNIFLIKESVITGYYIYDKEQGLIHVDRFANGEKYDETGFNKLSEVTLTLDGKHTIKKDEDGNNRIDAFPMYDREYLHDENGEIVIDENGNYKENPNSIFIEDGTKIHINNISDDGYSYNFKTEDGSEYTINYRYT